jgi:aldose 1-epimerase
MKTTLPFRFLTSLLLFFVPFQVAGQGQEKEEGGITREVFGTMPDGREVYLFTLRNGTGMAVQVTNYGGYLVSWTAPDRRGQFENITLGLPTFADYLKGTPALGPVIGRYANRIAGGRFTLDGKPYQLTTNGTGNHIHGGKAGFDKKLWTATPLNGKEPALKLIYTSPDGEEGYPGTLVVEVTYTLQRDNALRIDYRATTDQPTLVNLTNHAYFNLSGMKRDILGHVLTIPADRFLPTDKAQLPTGQRQPVAGTPFDFTQPTSIGARINDTTHAQIRYGFGYDHCWVVADAPGQLRPAATVYEPESGRLLEVSTTEPGVQLYTGNHLNGTLRGREGVLYTRRWGLCLETQHFPDSPNHPDFPTTILRPGQTFRSTTVYKASVK